MYWISSHCILKHIKSLKRTFRILYMSSMMSIQVSVLLCTLSRILIASMPRKMGQKSLLKSILKQEMVNHPPTVAATTLQHNRLWCQAHTALQCIDTSKDHRFGPRNCTTGKATLTSTTGLQIAPSKLSLARLKPE